MEDNLWFKVLVDGESCHGGDFKWSLPAAGEPGQWHEVPATEPLRLCSVGFHLTDQPAKWWKNGAVAYIAEVDGEKTRYDSADAKVAVRKVRLLRAATDAELNAAGIFLTGNHTTKEGASIASGSAKVEASGSAKVEASGSAKVEASGSAKVTASGSANVTASGSANVTAYGSANVTAYGSANVTAYGSAKVEAYDSAKVTASGSANVTAYGSANVTAYGSANVTAYGSANVTAYDSAKVTASGSANVTAYGSANVTAYDSAKVTAYGSANVTAYDSAKVTASGSAKVEADGRSTILKQSRRAAVRLLGLAVEVDWTTEKAEFRRAGEPVPTAAGA